MSGIPNCGKSWTALFVVGTALIVATCVFVAVHNHNADSQTYVPDIPDKPNIRNLTETACRIGKVFFSLDKQCPWPGGSAYACMYIWITVHPRSTTSATLPPIIIDYPSVHFQPVNVTHWTVAQLDIYQHEVQAQYPQDTWRDCLCWHYSPNINWHFAFWTPAAPKRQATSEPLLWIGVAIVAMCSFRYCLLVRRMRRQQHFSLDEQYSSLQNDSSTALKTHAAPLLDEHS